MALAQYVTETGSFDFVITDIAARAGVSPRTVYNHFGDRQGLIEALSEFAQREMERRGGTDIPATLHELPGLVAPNFGAMEAVPELSEAFARLDYASQPSANRARRTVLIHELVKAAYPDLSERHGEVIAAIIRNGASSTTWHRLTREHGLTSQEAASASAWTMRLQIEALDRGDLPDFSTEDPHQASADQ